MTLLYVLSRSLGTQITHPPQKPLGNAAQPASPLPSSEAVSHLERALGSRFTSPGLWDGPAEQPSATTSLAPGSGLRPP